jgi:hypothetical protein
VRHEESGGKEEASLADRRADDDAKAGLLSCMCSGPEVGKGWPHRVDAGLLLEQGACEMWGEINIRAGRVSTGRVSPRIGEQVY